VWDVKERFADFVPGRALVKFQKEERIQLTLQVRLRHPTRAQWRDRPKPPSLAIV